ncbi:MAG: thioesterase II family protein [Saprospiraceae bacterium]
MQLICLPYSGGSSFAYQPLAAYWSKSWKVTTLILPGRGQRIGEPLVVNMEDLVNDCWQQIKNHLEQPYAFFGHSLGSRLAYLLAHKAREEGCSLPVHLFLSGTKGPSVPPTTPYRYLFSKTAFKNKLEEYGGISEELLNNADAFDFFEPIIRADFQAIETWKYYQKAALNIPTTVITGTAEEMTEKEVQKWQQEFSTKVAFIKMKGNHFFLFNHPQQFVALMQNHLQETLSKQPIEIGK